MPKSPEHVIGVNVRDARMDEFEIEREAENIPDTAEKVASLLRIAYVEAKGAKPGAVLSDDARFVKALEETLEEFYKKRFGNLAAERRPNLERFISVLDGKVAELPLPPDQVRELMAAVLERFGVPEREDLTVSDETGPVKNQPGRIGAHDRLIDGIRDSWQTVLRASLREHYAEHFPAEVQADVEDILNAQNDGMQQNLMRRLVDRVQNASPYRFRRFIKALARSRAETDPAYKRNDSPVTTQAELDALAQYIASRLPEGRQLPVPDIIKMIKQASPNEKSKERVPLPREVLSLIIEGFSRDLKAVYDLADPELLFEASIGKESDYISNTLRGAWMGFTMPQRSQLLELVKTNFVRVEPTGKEGVQKGGKKSETVRAKLAKCVKNLATDAAEGTQSEPDEVERFVELMQRRVDEILEYRTAVQERGDDSDDEREAAVAAQEADEQERLSPAALYQVVRERLSQQRAYIPAIRRMLLRTGMEAARQEVYKNFLAVAGNVHNKNELITFLLTTKGATEKGIRGAQRIIEENGDSDNRHGWDLILKAGNMTADFRLAMGRGLKPVE